MNISKEVLEITLDRHLFCGQILSDIQWVFNACRLNDMTVCIGYSQQQHSQN